MQKIRTSDRFITCKFDPKEFTFRTFEPRQDYSQTLIVWQLIGRKRLWVCYEISVEILAEIRQKKATSVIEHKEWDLNLNRQN